MSDTAYNKDQILRNERGWLFYESALKGWKEIYAHLEGDSVLDIGCASGISMGLIKLFQPKMSVVGLEGNESARELWDARGLQVVVGDIYKLPFPSNSFDTVYSSHVLEHVDDPRTAIVESIRAANRRIIHVVPDGNIDEKNHGSPHLHHFNRISFEELFEEFDIKQIAYKAITDNHINSLVAVYDV